MKFIKFYFLLFYSLSFLLYSTAMAYEETIYKLVNKNEVYEIRKYSDRLAVETITTDQNNSFRKLFKYISGSNKTNEEIKMTTPVTQIEKEGKMTMQFYLPNKYNKENAPDPSRSDVKIVNIEGGYYAVIRYSGRASDKNFFKHKDILEKELLKNNVSVLSQAIKATYNGPFTLPMFRRNEAMFKVKF